MRFSGGAMPKLNAQRPRVSSTESKLDWSVVETCSTSRHARKLSRAAPVRSIKLGALVGRQRI
jgi:hypothetical protein